MGLDQWLIKNGDIFITWRKANMIHGYFDKLYNVENLEEYPVSLEDLQELKKRILEVLSNRKESVSNELLPVTRGCFFGSYLYDDYYYDELEWTLKELDRLFDSHCDDDYYSYEAWW